MTTEEMIAWIDAASYEDLLRNWRFAPAGDPFFMDEVGRHYRAVMEQRRNEVGPEAHIAASKTIGLGLP